MQRQLGTSQLPNSSSHRGSMMAPPTNGNMRNRQVCYYWCLYTLHICIYQFFYAKKIRQIDFTRKILSPLEMMKIFP